MRTFPSRFKNLDRARVRFGDGVDRIGAYLGVGDPLADAAVAELAALPGHVAGPMISAVAGGEPRATAEAPGALRRLIEDAAEVPAWVDWDSCDRGGSLVLRAGPLGGLALGAESLVLGYASPGGNKPLVFSGRLKEQAASRLNETARFVQAVSRPGGMRPHADGWRAAVKVRLMHAKVRRMILATGEWDEGAWGLPINQHDMAATTILFSIAMIDGLRKLGLSIDAEEAERYVHLWRFIGRVMGVDEGILPASEADSRRLAAVIEATSAPPDQDSRDLTAALFEAGRLAATTEAARRAADRRVVIGQTFCRALLGDELADALGVPRTRWRFALPLLRSVVTGVDRATRALGPLGERRALASGERYWQNVVELGLPGATYDFPLPDRLAARWGRREAAAR